MTEVISLAFTRALQKLLNTIQNERHYQSDRREAALKAIQRALIETKKHIEMSEGDRSDEYLLASLWAEASAAVRYYDEDFARKLNVKSRFWQDPGAWPQEIVSEKGIDLSSIEKEIEAMLKN